MMTVRTSRPRSSPFSLFAFRDRAADQDLALLEIACDAAARFADDYNHQNPAR